MFLKIKQLEKRHFNFLIIIRKTFWKFWYSSCQIGGDIELLKYTIRKSLSTVKWRHFQPTISYAKADPVWPEDGLLQVAWKTLGRSSNSDFIELPAKFC